MKIVRTHRYTKDLRRLRLSERHQDALEQSIANDPQVGAVIPALRAYGKYALQCRGEERAAAAELYIT